MNFHQRSCTLFFALLLFMGPFSMKAQWSKIHAAYPSLPGLDEITGNKVIEDAFGDIWATGDIETTNMGLPLYHFDANGNPISGRVFTKNNAAGVPIFTSGSGTALAEIPAGASLGPGIAVGGVVRNLGGRPFGVVAIDYFGGGTVYSVRPDMEEIVDIVYFNGAMDRVFVLGRTGGQLHILLINASVGGVNREWFIPGAIGTFSRSVAMIQTSTSDLVICGEIDQGHRHPYLARLTYTGGILSMAAQSYTLPPAPFRSYYPVDIVESFIPGRIVMAFYQQSNTGGTFPAWKTHLLEVDPSMNLTTGPSRAPFASPLNPATGVGDTCIRPWALTRTNNHYVVVGNNARSVGFYGAPERTTGVMLGYTPGLTGDFIHQFSEYYSDPTPCVFHPGTKEARDTYDDFRDIVFTSSNEILTTGRVHHPTPGSGKYLWLVRCTEGVPFSSCNAALGMATTNRMVPINQFPFTPTIISPVFPTLPSLSLTPMPLTVEPNDECSIPRPCKNGGDDLEEDLSENNAITMYPNPTNGNVTLEIPQDIQADNWELFSLRGKKVAEGSLNTVNGQAKLNFQAQSEGLYFLMVQSNGQRIFTQRVSVIK